MYMYAYTSLLGNVMSLVGILTLTFSTMFTLATVEPTYFSLAVASLLLPQRILYSYFSLNLKRNNMRAKRFDNLKRYSMFPKIITLACHQVLEDKRSRIVPIIPITD